ncbi:hypothetical protein [Actinacidiphila yeochonensis]|uniref:hypothetical protein n=1 Tax=Actinacidiphila yeochonensis TaxID=89050 RepID=UPI00055FADD3|nr:hypothetical protein [Actinacidiphila yeochonensis]
MTATAFEVPVTGLSGLPTETRVLATPWSRMVRGIGLGQHPTGYDPASAARIRRTFALLAERGVERGPYARFSRLLAELVLDLTDPDRAVAPAELRRRLDAVLAGVHDEPNPYFAVTAGCVLMDAFAKLGLGPELLAAGGDDLAGHLLATVDTIEPDRAKDENAGRHGHYEKLSAYTAVFLAFGHLDVADRLVTGSRHRVLEALDLLDEVPAPFFRGRGGATLLSATALLGHRNLVADGRRDRVKEVLDHLDRADGTGAVPAFPQPMSEAFVRIYPLLTMLTAVATTARPQEYLTHGRDRLAEAADLMARITPVERTHMGLYYLMALHNLGRLRDQLPDLDAFLAGLVSSWTGIDPGANYFLNGISYAYLVQTAMVTGRMDLIGTDMLARLVDCFPDLDRSDDDRVNRPYPFAYTLNVLGEIGAAHLLFEPRDAYGGRTATAWVVGRLSEGGREEHRLYMLHHALISYALRQRDPRLRDTALLTGFRFPSAR